MGFRIISKEQELKDRAEQFKKLKPGTLFKYTTIGPQHDIVVHHCIAVRQFHSGEWVVIELKPGNRQRIIEDLVSIRSTVSFEEMSYLNIVAE